MSEGDKNNVPDNSNMGLVIAFGAGIGIVFGEFVFNSVGIGITIAVGLGLILNRFNRIK